MNLSSLRPVWVVCGCAVGAALLSACGDADPIPPGAGSIAVSVQASTSGTGRYETASFPVSRIVVRPVDELGTVVFDSKPIALTITRVPGNLAPGASILTVTSALPPGRYRVDTLGLFPPALIDTTVPLPAPTKCIENLASVPEATGAQIPQITYFSFQLTGSDWEFEITPGAQQLALTVDAPAFVELLENSFTCDDSSGTATLTAFNTSAYQSGLLPLLAMRK